MMNTRALMELIVINIGYDMGVISRPMLTMLLIMALVSTVITTPVLRRYWPRLLGWDMLIQPWLLCGCTTPMKKEKGV